MTVAQERIVREDRLTVVARCAGRSRSLIVRQGRDRRLFYLSPPGLYRRCR